MNSLTFIIPAYGKSDHIKDCISSLLTQAEPKNILITTSTPSDFLKNIADFFGVKLIVSPNRSSIAADWNFALDSSSSDLVVLAHQDDLYHPEFSSEITRFFFNNPGAAIAFTDSLELSGNYARAFTKREVVKRIIRHFAFMGKSTINSKFANFRLFAFGCPIPCPSVIFNRKKLGRFLFAESFTVNLDWDLWSRIGASGASIGYINKSLLTHRIHENAETQLALKEFRRHKEDFEIFLRFWPRSIAAIILHLYKLGY